MRITTLALCTTIAGSMAVPASALASEPGTPTRDTMRHNGAQTGINFVSVSTIQGQPVTSPQGDEIGTVENLLVERGTGRVSRVIVESGDWMGLGGRSVAIPYSEFGWNPADQRLVLNKSKEQLKSLPEFSADEWNAGNTGENSAFLGDLGNEHAVRNTDPYANDLNNDKSTELRGTIKSVHRDKPYGKSDEHITLTVETDQGAKRVFLGPAWYVMSSDNPPMRDDTVQISACELATTSKDDHTKRGHMMHRPDYVATSITVDGKQLDLRTKNGHPAWRDTTSNDNDNTFRRYALLTNLDGKNVDCHGKACGEVDDTVIECSSGILVFLVIDPDESFLGIADTSRLVPFSVASISSSDIVRIDATKQMVLDSRKAPDDFTQMTEATGRSIYDAFGVELPNFERRRSAWSSRTR